MKKVILFLMILILPFSFIGCSKSNKDNDEDKEKEDTIVGRYELKEIIYGDTAFTVEGLLRDRGQIIKIDVTGDKVIKYITYYSPDGDASDSKDEYKYDEEYLFDIEDNSIRHYSYTYSDGELVLKNLNEEETIKLTKLTKKR